MMGEAAVSLVDLGQSLGQSQVQRISELYVGQSFASYEYDGALYALPIDAAAPAASYRPDLLDRAGLTPPSQWSELLDMARLGKVRMPGFPADLFLNWMGLCVSIHDSCARDSEHLLDREDALFSLEELRALASFMPDSIYEWNPIALYEAMTAGDEFAYCPFAYTYSNYSRKGFALHPIQFAEPVSPVQGAPLRTVLGGTGIAISKKAVSLRDALHYSLFVADAQIQRDLYGPTGGQPAARAAWDDALLNRLSGNFFLNTRSNIENAYVRPRYRGYIPLQEAGGVHVARYLRGQASAEAALDAIDQLYRNSLRATNEPHRVEEVQTSA
jgi:multiple sugar transport system substrate-binding protein